MANTIRIKRRTGLTGAPSSLWGAEFAYNEYDHILFIGEGSGGEGGTASVIAPIAGPGAFVTRGAAGTTQTIDGLKTFTSNVTITDGSASALLSGSSIFDLLGSPTTINFGLAATNLNIGAVTGKTTVRNDFDVLGDFTISGNTSFSNTVVIDGDLAVNGGDLTSSAAAFNFLNTGVTTLNIGGDATIVSIGDVTGKTTINNANTDISGFLWVDDGIRTVGDLAVNGGDITTTSATASVFNTAATTVNAFGAATTLNFGAVTGTTTVGNKLKVNGQFEVAGTSLMTGNTVISGDLAVNGGDITSSSSTFNAFATSTTVNIGAAATTFNIGAVTGTTTVRNDLHVTGATQLTANVEFLGSAVIEGDLTVNGTFTTINSSVVTVEDINLELGKLSDGTPTDDTANGGGITLKGASDKTITWDKVNANWTSSENWNIGSGKVYKIGNTQVLSANTLGSGVIYSSLQTLGTITTGVWNASTIAAIYGGTGYSSYVKGNLLWADSTTTLAKLAIGSYDATNGVGQMLQVGPNSTVQWSSVIDGGTY